MVEGKPPASGRDGKLAVVGVFVVFLLANYELLWGDGVPKWDADQQFAPWYMLVADFARNGELLLWNPWSNGGSPDFAEPQIGAFSPITILFGLVTGPTLQGYVVYWLSVWLAGGLGFLVLARYLKAPMWGAFVVTLGYVFSGVFTGHAQHFSHVYTLAWLPWIIWRIDIALCRQKVRPALEAGALWGLSALAGYPALVLLNFCFLVCWTVGRILFGLKTDESSVAGRGWIRAGAVVGLAATIGLLVLSPTYLGFLYEGRGFTDRVGKLPREVAIESNALHPAALSTFASPHLSMLWYLNDRAFWEYTDGSSNSIYLGILPLVLAVAGVVIRPRDRWRWWLVFLAFGSILLALGRVLPFRGWTYDLFLPFRYFRHASIFRDYYVFSVALLAILGAKDLDLMRLRHYTVPRYRVVLPTLCLTLVAAIGFVVVMRAAPKTGDSLIAILHLVIVWSVTCGVVLLWSGRSSEKTRRVGVKLLVGVAILDALFTYHLTRYTIYDDTAGLRTVWTRIENNHVGSLDLRQSIRVPVASEGTNKNLPAKIPVLASYSPFSNRFHLGSTRHPYLAGLAVGSDRFWFSPQPAVVPLSDKAFEAVSARSETLQAPVFVLHEPRAMQSLTASSAAAESTLQEAIGALPSAEWIGVSVRTYLPRLLELRVVDCPSDGWLLVTDRWAQGWRAEVNGRPVEVWGANFVYRAVSVRRGVNTIKFEYQPTGFPAALIISWLTLSLVVLVSLGSSGRRKVQEILHSVFSGRHTN